MPATASSRSTEIRVSVRYRDDVRDLGIFDTWEGGNVSADNTKHRRGGMGPQVAVGGPKTIEDITITRDYDVIRDHPDAHWLSSVVGRARVTASKSWLDENDRAYGRPIVITGVLIGYNNPASDSDSGDIAMVSLVINPDGEVG
jgi:hypothetical protein